MFRIIDYNDDNSHNLVRIVLFSDVIAEKNRRFRASKREMKKSLIKFFINYLFVIKIFVTLRR